MARNATDSVTSSFEENGEGEKSGGHDERLGHRRVADGVGI
jgi:hypothetical protein